MYGILFEPLCIYYHSHTYNYESQCVKSKWTKAVEVHVHVDLQVHGARESNYI